MADPKLKIALLICSTRKPRVAPSIAAWVVSALTSTLPPSIILETVDLADYPLPISPSGSVIPAKITVPGTPVPKGAYHDAQIDAWSQKVTEYAGFVFVTPQYNWNVPAALKVALDHLFHEWVAKPALIVSYGAHGGGKCALALRGIWAGLRGGKCGAGVELAIGGGRAMELAQMEGVLDQSVVEAWESDGMSERVVAGFADLVDGLGLDGTRKVM